jgi:hypothetical protein
MSYQTLSENIVAALITAARGDFLVNLKYAANQLEAWQQEHDCHFGTGRSDVSSSLQLLWYADPQLSDACRTSSQVLNRLSLSDVLPILLTYKHWCSNDEGEFWAEASTRYPGGGKTEIRSTSFRTYKLKQYTKTGFTQNADETLRFLCKLGLDEQHLRDCARSGPSS